MIVPELNDGISGHPDVRCHSAPSEAFLLLRTVLGAAPLLNWSERELLLGCGGTATSGSLAHWAP